LSWSGPRGRAGASVPRRSKASQADQLNELARELEERARKLRAIAVSIDGLETDAAKVRQISDLLS
jgi:uncharacterized protein (DUF1501 family)